MATTVISRVFYTGRSGGNWQDSGEPYPPTGKSWTDDQNDATYLRHTNALPSSPSEIEGTAPAHTAPGGQQLHAVRLCSRARCWGGSTSIDAQPSLVWGGIWTYSPPSGPTALGTAFTGHNWAWINPPTTALTGDVYFNLYATGARPKFDLSELWLEYDYRAAPAFGLTASAGLTKQATIAASWINLDGLPARNWSVAVTGPTNWSASGAGAFPGVTTPDLPNGNYSATVTIASTIRGGVAYATSAAVGFTVDYRNKPAFNLSADVGLTRYANINATSIDLDGLPAHSWALNISGPTNWSTSGSGAYPGVTTPWLLTGSYTATLTISSTYGGSPYATTKSVGFSISRKRPSFTLSASAGITKQITITAANLNLDGLPPLDWGAHVSGPTNWSIDGTGAFPGSVTTPDLANGEYSVSLAIFSDYSGLYGQAENLNGVKVDYRNKPAFNLAASSGSGRYAQVTVSAVDLDGLPPRDWSLDISGPMSWSASGGGDFPPLGVTTSELADGNYTATVTVSSTYAGSLVWSTTKSVNFTVDSLDPFTLLCDTDYESTLASHFDVACNSMGAVWWCDKNGVVQFAKQPPATAAWTFTDRPGSDGVKYTDLRIAYDSRNLVNDLDATNKTLVDDVRHRYHEPTSVAMWGSRTDSVDLTVYDAGGALAKRVKALVDKFATLARLPDRITFRAADFPACAAGLDLYQKVTIEYDGETFTCLVVGIDHNILPENWTVTVHLMKA